MPMGLLEYAHYALQVSSQTSRDPKCLCFAVGILGRIILFIPIPDRERFCETTNVMELLVAAALMGQTGIAVVIILFCVCSSVQCCVWTDQEYAVQLFQLAVPGMRLVSWVGVFFLHLCLC